MVVVQTTLVVLVTVRRIDCLLFADSAIDEEIVPPVLVPKLVIVPAQESVGWFQEAPTQTSIEMRGTFWRELDGSTEVML